MSLLMQPVFLSTLSAERFASLPRKHLFAEIARLDRLLDSYPALIENQLDSSVKASLIYCHNQCLTRYDALRKLV